MIVLYLLIDFHATCHGCVCNDRIHPEPKEKMKEQGGIMVSQLACIAYMHTEA